MRSGTWFLNSFLMKTVIYKLAHVCLFLFADNKRLLNLYPFICSPLRACERSPFSLMVQAPGTNHLLENQGICFPDTTTGMSASLCNFLGPDRHPTQPVFFLRVHRTSHYEQGPPDWSPNALQLRTIHRKGKQTSFHIGCGIIFQSVGEGCLPLVETQTHSNAPSSTGNVLLL